MKKSKANIKVLMCSTALFGILQSNFASAVNECGAENLANPTDTVSCATGAYPAGITYLGSDGMTLDLNAVGIDVVGSTNGVRVFGTTDGDMIINATNFGAITTTGGVPLSGNGTGLRTEIDTTVASPANAQIIMNSGDVSTNENGDEGVLSFIHDTGAADVAITTGEATIVMTGGTVITKGTNATAVHSRNEGLGLASVIITGPSITLETQQEISAGVGAEITNVSSTNNVITSFDGASITTTGNNNSMGIIAANAGAGDAIATLVNGTVSTAGASNNLGVFSVSTGTGNTVATMDNGSVTTNGSGNGSHGIYSFVVNGAGSATATLNAGSVTVLGRQSVGVLAQNDGSGDAFANLVSGSITTNQDIEAGLGSFLTAGNASGAATTVMTAGNIITNGNDSVGLAATIWDTTNSSTNSVVMNGGVVTTNGGDSGFTNGAHGILAWNKGPGLNVVEVHNDSQVTATGANSSGLNILMEHAGATYSVVVDGSAVITGGSADALALYTSSITGNIGTIDIANGASINGTTGAVGVFDDDGSVTMNLDGEIIPGAFGAIYLGGADDVLTINATASIAGDIGMDYPALFGAAGTEGSDIMTVIGANVDNVTLFDGGDDALITDGLIDVLNLNGVILTANGGIFINWEVFNLGSGSDLTLSGTLDTAQFNNLGSLTLDGIVDITGNYDSTGGVINVNAVSDVLNIGGDSTGSTVLNIDPTLLSGNVADSGMVIPVINVTGASTGVFTSPVMVVGVLEWTLQMIGNNWVLVANAIIDAVDDDFTAVTIDTTTGGIAGDVTSNDTLGDVLLTDTDVIITVVNDGGLTGVTIDANGNLIVPAGTPIGTYTINYMICEVALPSNCDSANAIVNIFFGPPRPIPVLSNFMLITLILALLGFAGFNISSRKKQ